MKGSLETIVATTFLIYMHATQEAIKDGSSLD